jgi:hypothetical protein
MQLLFMALEYNIWFERLAIDSQKLSSETTVALVTLLARNRTLKEISLDGTVLARDGILSMAEALRENQESAIQVIEIQKVDIDDKGAS